jgi:aspartokinase
MRIKGLKISGALYLVRLHNSTSAIARLSAFCSIMAGSRINLPFISTDQQADGGQAVCCVDAKHQMLIKKLVDADPMVKKHVSYVPDVGMLTLFPHQSSLKLFAMSLRTLSRENIRVLAMASSIGALTYVLDYVQLETAAELLKSCFKLDGNHAPFKAEFVVCQTTQSRHGRPE